MIIIGGKHREGCRSSLEKRNLIINKNDKEARGLLADDVRGRGSIIETIKSRKEKETKGGIRGNDWCENME